MRLQYKTIVLENHAEVRDVCYGPTAWDNDPGGICSVQFAAQNYFNVPESQSHKFSLSFASGELEQYYDSLVYAQNYYDIDITTGEQSKTYWPSEIIREDDNPYLIAIRFMMSEGIDNFTLKHVIGDIFQAVDIKNNKSFIFKDTIDLSIYQGLLCVISDRGEKTTKQNISNELSEFMGTNE